MLFRSMPLPAVLDNRDAMAKHLLVLKQDGNSCTGHAVATVINTVLSQSFGQRMKRSKSKTLQPVKVSAYMLYRLARRYDEFQGEADTGSSLRAAFKGWFHHGVLEEAAWSTLKLDAEPDLSDSDVLAQCRQRPLGAFYRVNPYRLDDMQSAINELHVIAVSAAVHEGWNDPVVVQKGSEQLRIIQRAAGQRIGQQAAPCAATSYCPPPFLANDSMAYRASSCC